MVILYSSRSALCPGMGPGALSWVQGRAVSWGALAQAVFRHSLPVCLALQCGGSHISAFGYLGFSELRQELFLGLHQQSSSDFCGFLWNCLAQLWTARPLVGAGCCILDLDLGGGQASYRRSSKSTSSEELQHLTVNFFPPCSVGTFFFFLNKWFLSFSSKNFLSYWWGVPKPIFLEQMLIPECFPLKLSLNQRQF